MRGRTGAIVAMVVLVVLVFFTFIPFVHTTTRPPIDQLAFLGPQSASESLSCAIFGVGAGYWQTATIANPTLRWSYELGCPPPPATGVTTFPTTTCSTYASYILTTTVENGSTTETITEVVPVC